jgi:hypothetical protein
MFGPGAFTVRHFTVRHLCGGFEVRHVIDIGPEANLETMTLDSISC